MSDPFAEANLNGAASNGTSTATQERPANGDPFVDPADLDDPFATRSDLRTDFTPSPSLEALQGRLVVMIPRSLDPNAKDPNDPSGEKTREVYTVDLTVLTGGELKFFYNQKGNPEAQDPADRQDKLVEFVVPDVSVENPFSVEGFWVPQGGVIGALKKVHKAGRPYLGVPTMVPVKADREKGITAAMVQANFAQWEAAGRKTNRPKYTWTLADPSPAERPLAIKWWAANRGSIKAITPA
jgi:hypothetical protein